MKNKLSLVQTSLLGQIVSFLSLPFIARIFEVKDVAAFGLVTVFSSFFQSFGILKLDSKVWIADNEERRETIAAAFSFTIVSGLLFTSIVFPLFIAKYTTYQALNCVLFFLSNVLLGFASIFLAICIYKREFRIIGVSNFIRISVAGVIQVVLGKYFNTFEVLMVGLLCGQIASLIYVYSQKNGDHKFAKYSEMKKQIVSNWYFSKYATLEAICNSLLAILPAVLIGNNYGSKFLGFYYVSERIIGIGNQVFTENVRVAIASDLSTSKSNRENYKSVKWASLAILFVGIVSCTLYTFFGQEIIRIGLGQQYQGIHDFFIFALVGWIFRIITIPAYVLLQSKLKQKYLAFWSFSKLILSAVLLLFYVQKVKFSYFILTLNLSYVVFAILFLFSAWLIIRKTENQGLL